MLAEIYRPDSLVVGTRGRPDSLFKSAFMGSISKYCVARSPVPVVVVRPDDKVRESLEKRVAQGAKRSYVSLLGDKVKEGTGTVGYQGSGLERMESAPQAAASKGNGFARYETVG